MEISLDDIQLDPDNPRLYHLRAIHDKANMTDSEMYELIIQEPGWMTFERSIKKRGVEVPISVSVLPNGKYRVNEGNRRTCALRELIRKGSEPPPGVRFDIVIADVADQNTSELEIKINKVIQQTGKKDWTPLGVAAAIHELHFEYYQSEEDIASDMQLSKTKVVRHLTDYVRFLDYVKHTGDTNEKRFTYFAEAPKPVLNWVDESKENKEYYYDWINPNSGHTKIRSAAAGRGSLREFSKCLNDDDAMDLLRNDPHTTVEEAFDVVKSNDVMKDIPFLNRIIPMAKSINELDENQIQKIADRASTVQSIKSLKFACERLLEDLDTLRED